MKRPWVVLLAVVLCAGLVVAGCATSRGIKNAQAQLEKAKAAGAEKPLRQHRGFLLQNYPLLYNRNRIIGEVPPQRLPAPAGPIRGRNRQAFVAVIICPLGFFPAVIFLK